MAHRIKVQDDAVIYQKAFPDNRTLVFNIDGTLNADVVNVDGTLTAIVGDFNEQVNVGTDAGPSMITFTGGDTGEIKTIDGVGLNIYTGTGGPLEIRSGSGGSIKIIGPIIDNLVLSGSATLQNVPNPVFATDAVNKNYVDSISQGITWKQGALAATTANINLLAPASAVLDGVTLVAGNRVLVKNQTLNTENGIYLFNGVAVPMTRPVDADTGADLVGASLFVQSGTIYKNTQWVQTTLAPITIGTSPIVWSQFGAPIIYSAGIGLQLIGTVFSNTGVLSLGVGEGISVTANTGNIVVGNTGVLSLTGTANQITVSTATGDPIVSLPTVITGLSSVTSTSFVGALTGNATSATNATRIAGGAAGQVVYQSAAGVTGFTATGTAGQVLSSTGTSAPVWIAPPSGASTVSTGVIATGASQGAATALTSLINEVSGVSGGNGVRLVTPIAGIRSTVINNSGSSINVYANTGGLINGTSVITIGNTVAADFVAVSPTQWYTISSVYA